MVNRTTNDDDLIRSAQQGSVDAFNTLYESYFPVVYRRVRCVAPEADVEDITQDVFIAVVRSLKNFRFEAQFSTWLRTLVNRQVADYYRSRKSRCETYPLDGYMDDSDGEGEDRRIDLSVEDRTSSSDEFIVLYQALRNLPDNYREIIMLRFVDGLRFDEIAQVQGQSLEATKSLFRRAITTLQKRMTSE
jgi:RNA polymerase sigma-70 factor (ECF subfamily)